jgi:hypothetical protein
LLFPRAIHSPPLLNQMNTVLKIIHFLLRLFNSTLTSAVYIFMLCSVLPFSPRESYALPFKFCDSPKIYHSNVTSYSPYATCNSPSID